MKEITALTILTVSQYLMDRVGVICEGAKEVEEEVERWMGVDLTRHVTSFEFGSDPDQIRGYRFDIILIEGSSGNMPERFRRETLAPFLSDCEDTTMCRKLSHSMGRPIPKEWIKRPQVIFTEE